VQAHPNRNRNGSSAAARFAEFDALCNATTNDKEKAHGLRHHEDC